MPLRLQLEQGTVAFLQRFLAPFLDTLAEPGVLVEHADAQAGPADFDAGATPLACILGDLPFCDSPLYAGMPLILCSPTHVAWLANANCMPTSQGPDPVSPQLPASRPARATPSGGQPTSCPLSYCCIKARAKRCMIWPLLRRAGSGADWGLHPAVRGAALYNHHRLSAS